MILSHLSTIIVLLFILSFKNSIWQNLLQSSFSTLAYYIWYHIWLVLKQSQVVLCQQEVLLVKYGIIQIWIAAGENVFHNYTIKLYWNYWTWVTISLLFYLRIHLVGSSSWRLWTLFSNNISEINGGAFSKLKLLLTLDISQNSLQSIPTDAFDGLNLLQTLNMSHNSLQSLPDNIFSGLNLLQILDMSSNKKLTLCDNAFSGLHNLLSLYLNNISSVSSNTTFSGLGNLTTLDLSSYAVNIATMPDPLFQYLHSLQTLSLYYPYVGIVGSATFAGLSHSLQVLYIKVGDMTTYNPFAQLSSLQHLDLKLQTCNGVNESLFVGLDKLKHLRLSNNYRCIIDLSSLVSLTYLRYDNWDKSHTYIHIFNSLNSSLQTLQIHYPYPVRFNLTTFESLPKWKESLRELKMYLGFVSYDNFQIEGSPFKWFPQLQLLQIQGLSIPHGSASSWASPEDTFKGLANLTEVHLNYLGIDNSVADHVLSSFADYPLKVLNLAHNNIYTGNDIAFKIGRILTLKP